MKNKQSKILTVFFQRDSRSLRTLALRLTLLLGLVTLPSFLSPIRYTAPLSQKHFWMQTDVKNEWVLEKISNVSCHQNELQFFACLSGLRSAGLEYGWFVNFAGEWTSSAGVNANERSELLSWQLLSEQQELKLDFENLIEELRQKISLDEHPYLNSLLLNGYFSVRYDPHTYIVPMGFYENLFFGHGLQQLDEIGATIRSNPQGTFVRFVHVGSPSERAGLQKGDQILRAQSLGSIEEGQIQILGSVYIGFTRAKADQELESDESEIQNSVLKRSQRKRRAFSDEQSIAQTIRSARSSGKSLKLTVRRQDQILDVVLRPQRQLYPLAEVRRVGREVYNMRIHRIVNGICQKVKADLLDLKAQNLQGLILDLRDNTGGSVDEAQCILDLFTRKGQRLFETHYLEDGRKKESYISKNDPLFVGPLVVLVNSSTASAAEIIAGSLQDTGRAQILGTRTFGKASFQDGEVWNNSSDIVMFRTRGVFVFPSGWSPQGVGIEPDHVIQALEEEGYRELDLYFSALVPVDEDRARRSRSASQDLMQLVRKMVPRTDCVNLEAQVNQDLGISQQDLFLTEASKIVKGCPLGPVSSENGSVTPEVSFSPNN